jgi:hypothetical protein
MQYAEPRKVGKAVNFLPIANKGRNQSGQYNTEISTEISPFPPCPIADN